uniref:Uncharacterized protein n=1 Tax=Anopheles braziliensis TaxID=58242 RepID=A0A2M3ZM32_9DIPT
MVGKFPPPPPPPLFVDMFGVVVVVGGACGAPATAGVSWSCSCHTSSAAHRHNNLQLHKNERPSCLKHWPD